MRPESSFWISGRLRARMQWPNLELARDPHRRDGHGDGMAVHHDPYRTAGGHQTAEGTKPDGEIGIPPVGLDLRRQFGLRHAAVLVVLLQRVVVAARFAGEDCPTDHEERPGSSDRIPRGDLAASDGRRLHVRDRRDERSGRQDDPLSVATPRVVGVDPRGRVELVRYHRFDTGVVQAVEAQRVGAVSLDDLGRRSDQPALRDLPGGTGADSECIRQAGVGHVVRGDAVAFAARVEQPEGARGDGPDCLRQVSEGHPVAEDLAVFVAVRCRAGERDDQETEGVIEISCQVTEPGGDLGPGRILHADDDVHPGDRDECVVQRLGLARVVEAGLRAAGDGDR